MRSILIVLVLGCLPNARAALAEESPGAIFVMNRDGSGLRPLVSIEGFPRLGAPRWSHDGKKLVFDARGDQPEKRTVFVVAADGSALTGIGPGTRADWSPDDKQLAFAAVEGMPLNKGIWVQNVDGRGRQRLAEGDAAQWSPDGSLIAVVDGRNLQILDQIDSSRRAIFESGDGITNVRPGFAWSPDGTELAAAVERNGAWEVVIAAAANPRPELRTRLTAKADSLAWSPDGKTLAVALWNAALGAHRLHLLPAAGDEPPQEIPGQQGDNRQPAWSSDAEQLAFASSRPGGVPRAVPLAVQPVKLELVTAHDTGGTCYSLAIAPDGRTALLGGNMGNRVVQVWDLDGKAATRKFPMLGIFVAVSPDGQYGACTELYKSSVTYFKLDDGKPVREFPLGAFVSFVEFSSDGSRLLAGSQNGDALVFDIRSGDKLARLGHAGAVSNGAFSPDGSIVATAAYDNKVHLWDAASGKKLREFDHPALVWGLAFSSDGRLLATGTGGTPLGPVSTQRVPVSDDNSVRLWDVASGMLVRQLEGHDHAVCGLAFSPDGQRLASGSFDGTLRLWSVERGAELSSAAGKGWIFKVAFSPDGKLALAAGGNARHQPSDARMVDYPDERVRVYKIAPVDKPAEE
jgi:WD40 repeat protein